MRSLWMSICASLTSIPAAAEDCAEVRQDPNDWHRLVECVAELNQQVQDLRTDFDAIREAHATLVDKI